MVAQWVGVAFVWGDVSVSLTNLKNAFGVGFFVFSFLNPKLIEGAVCNQLCLYHKLDIRSVIWLTAMANHINVCCSVSHSVMFGFQSKQATLMIPGQRYLCSRRLQQLKHYVAFSACAHAFKYMHTILCVSVYKTFSVLGLLVLLHS